MGAFEYSAVDAAGKTRKGVLEGDTPRQVRQQLREKGLMPLAVNPVAEGRGKSSGRRLGGGRIQASDLAVVTRQLATLVRSGIVLEEALGAVAEQAEKPRLKSVLMAVRSRILEGYAADRALGEFPRVFPELYRATLAAGEQAGHLDVVLERLADYTEARQQLQQKVFLALLYPVLLTVVAFAVISALLVYVVPQVVEVFAHIDQTLPALTVGLIAVSDFLQAHGLVLLLLAVGGFFLARVLLKREQIRRRVHRHLLYLPLLGKFIRTLDAARFARSFSIMIASGVPVLEGLKISSRVVANLTLREALERVRTKVREGASISKAMQAEGYFPPLTIHLIASGEASSNLEQMLDRAAATQERETETVISATMGLFEPLMIVVMGGIILIIVLAILLPIFELNQLVQ
ncbi:type II secretion system inner membrane protein GspF [Desulfurivibrio alkaliphilus]|uniref:General secretion pathway protein F n=1 Tax=Desulfurivibrio alkaliphilus (strain DSM 19089 / UNIQEM U267 / AHT2) TaxID=589865 RepID=D6Z6F8_DESAT|nr:type II secretion system inner membrane protein GspF [Desulfurivibrio alkaliphilus]ADH86923.1 general secretion pathway protein F [Desulfurivibrio alkaliphilus AHT 2]